MDRGVNRAIKTPSRRLAAQAMLAAACLATLVAVASTGGARGRPLSAPPTGAKEQPIQPAVAPFGNPPVPGRLSETGLYVAGSSSEIAPDVLAYAPQYPL